MTQKSLSREKFLFISPFFRNNEKHGGVKRTLQIIENLSELQISISNPYISLKNSFIYLRKNHLIIFKSFYFSLILYLFKGLSIRGFFLTIFKSMKFINLIDSNNKERIIIEGGGDLPIIFCQYLIYRKIKFISFLSNIEYLVPGTTKSNYFRNNFHKFKIELETYKYSEKLITISEYDQSILACHGIKSEYFPYFPEIKEKKKLINIREYRKNNLERIIKKGHIFILGTISNPPTKIGVENVINSIDNLDFDSPIILAGFGTNQLKKANTNRINILGPVSEKDLINLMKNAKCLIINQSQTSGFLIKIVEFNLAGIPIVVTSNYYQAKSLEKYGIYCKKLNLLNKSLLNKIINKNYKFFNKPKFEISMLESVYH